MMGLAAVVFGAAYRDWQSAARRRRGGRAPGAGCAGGALNALLIARLDIPPLIVTLGTFSLFRGIAEGLTRGAVNYTDFPRALSRLGQGYLAASFPRSCRCSSLILAAIRRAAASIGDRPRAGTRSASARPGARYAGIPVERRIGARSICSSGLIVEPGGDRLRRASRPGEIGRRDRLRARRNHRRRPRRHVGIRRARHAVGHLLGLFALSVLRNGLHLAALPSELTGVLTGYAAGRDDRDRSAARHARRAAASSVSR